MNVPIGKLAEYPFYTQLEVGNAKLTEVEWDFE